MIKDLIAAYKAVRDARRAGETGALCVVPEQELWEDKLWLSKRDYENQLMQKCIIGTTMGGGDGSICRYCQEHAEGACDKSSYMKKGCTDWWLRFLNEKENEACEQRAEKGFKEIPAQENEGKDPEPDQERADEERDNSGGSGKVVQGRF